MTRNITLPCPVCLARVPAEGYQSERRRCSQCDAMRAKNPELFDWFVRVIEQRVEDAVSEHVRMYRHD